MSDAVKPWVVAVGPLPPPLQGAAATTAAFIARLRAEGPLCVCNNATGTSGGSLARAAIKLGRTLRAMGGVLAGTPRPGRALYLALDGGWGLAYNLTVVVLARLCGYRLYLHHHSFAYLNQRSGLMALLCAAAGRRATHVVLCGGMGERLAARYPAAAHAFTLTSAALVDPPGAGASGMPRKGFTLGFLSNLILEKGLDTAVRIVREGRRRGLDLRLVLAGRAPDRAAEDFVAAAKAELGPALDVLGAIPEEAKGAFFARTDLFVFPTRYVNEAEPRAVIEALLHGVPALVPARGCLGEMVGSGSGMVVGAGDDFTEAALRLVERWIAAPALREAASAAAAARGKELRDQGRAQLDTLARRIAGTFPA